MLFTRRFVCLILACALISQLGGTPWAFAADDEGFVSLFNGTDLSGWHNVNTNPGTFYVRDKTIITTGFPTGYMRSAKQYENFILEFEWQHQNKTEVGNSGLFVWGDPVPAVGTGYTRSIEVQVLVNLNVKDRYTSHGDLFSIWGASCKPDRPHPMGWQRCLPSENRAKGGGEWNHYRITANNGVLKLAVNGKEVSGVSESRPRKGYLALESEGAECWFRNIRIKELPSTNPPADEVCDLDKGWKYLFHQPGLAQWKASDEHKQHWKMANTVLNFDGKFANSSAASANLTTVDAVGDCELMFDWKWSDKPKKAMLPGLEADGSHGKLVEVDDAGETFVTVRGAKVNLSCGPSGSGGVNCSPKSPKEASAKAYGPAKHTDFAVGKVNRMLIKVKGNRVTVRNNGTVVVENAELSTLSPKGPISLSAGSAMTYGNLFVRDLDANE